MEPTLLAQLEALEKRSQDVQPHVPRKKLRLPDTVGAHIVPFAGQATSAPPLEDPRTPDSRKKVDSRCTISFNALRRSRTTLEDFCKSYFMFHGLELSSFFQFLPILVFVEATIYQMDEENEDLCGAALKRNEPDQDKPGRVDDPLASGATLRSVLEEQQLMTAEVRQELDKGFEYWRMERLCCERLAQGGKVTLQEALQTSEGKSFDYRVLNLVLYALRGAAVDKHVMEVLFFNEHLVDIGDDLYDYEDDVVDNSFNIYRMFVNIYGQEAPLRLAARISEFEDKFRKGMQTLPAKLRESFQSRERAAMADSNGGRWAFPTPILDEDAYRAEVESSTRTKVIT